MAPTLKVETLTLEAAKVAVDACEAKARSMGLAMNIAVTDAATHLLHFSRMDGAKITSISIAIDKAFTACTCHHISSRLLLQNAVLPQLYQAIE
jgi:uncharacterized protein GlcG (DUF336 family)